MCCFKGGKQLTEGEKSQTRRRRGTSNSCVSHNHSLVLGNQTLVLKLIKKHKLQSTGRNYDSTVLTAKNHALFCKASHGKIDLFECAAELPEILGRVIGSITWSVISGSHQKPIKRHPYLELHLEPPSDFRTLQFRCKNTKTAIIRPSYVLFSRN